MSTDKNSTICVVGLGYIGLPTALAFANSGMSVRGVDINKNRVDEINDSLIGYEEPGLDRWLENALNHGKFTAYSDIEHSDIFIICVPTLIDEHSSRYNSTISCNLIFAINSSKSVYCSGESAIIIFPVPSNAINK